MSDSWQQYKKKSEQWDQFPRNIKERSGPIERESFDFHYTRFEVWKAGQCIASRDSDGVLVARVQGKRLLVEITDSDVEEHIVPKFEFKEISTNGDRILWSKDILNTGVPVEHNTPDVASLFYKNQSLAKVTFTIHDPNTLVEFYK